ncbi:MAG: DUF4012 domain-containing protein [Candidatus Dormibacteria bacterium]
MKPKQISSGSVGISGTNGRQRTSRRRKELRRRRILMGVAGAMGILALLTVYEAVHLGPTLRDLSHGRDALRDATVALGTSPSDWSTARITSAEPLRAEAEQRLSRGAARLRDDPLLGAIRPLPFLGTQVRTAEDLADASVAGASAFADVITVAKAYDAARQDPSSAGQRLLKLISAAGPPLSRANAALTPPLRRLQDDLHHALLAPLRRQLVSAVAQLSPAQLQAQAGAAAGKYAPAGLGADGPKTYLILLDNPAELRPAGGFAGAVGTVTFDQGALTKVDIRDQNLLNPLIKDHFDPPYPLGRYLVFYNNSLELGDAGWDPNFPSTAALSETIYQSATDIAPDGTIAIDPYALSAMLKLTGPLDVPGYGSFDSDNFFQRIDNIVNVSHSAGSGKGALGPISKVVIQKFLGQPLSAFPALLTIIQDQAKGRHLQIYMHNPDLAKAAAAARFDGALVGGHEDSLLVADGNVGATKGDYYMHKSMEVKVEVGGGGVSRHEVALNYDLPLPVDEADRALNPGAGTYLDYLRYYLPQTANVTSFHFTEDGKTSADGGLDRVTYEHGREVVGVFFRLPRGHRVRLTLDYRVPLPPDRTYDLYVQKEAGIPDRPTSVEISYPGGIVRRQADLSTDADFMVSW